MRKWIVVAAAAVLIVAVVVAIVVANLNGYLNDNKDWLAGQVEKSIGRKVGFDEIGVSVWGGLGVRLTNVFVADDPAFSDENLIRADRAIVRLRLVPALFGRYEITRVIFEHPALNIVRTDRGVNVTAFAGAQEGESNTGERQTAPLAIAYADVSSGTVRFVDKTTKPPTTIAFEQIDFSASDLRADAPIAFALRAAALGARSQNVELRGRVGPITGVAPQDVPVDAELQVSALTTDNLARVKEIAALLPKDLVVKGPASMQLAIEGTPSKMEITATVDATDAHVRYSDAFDKPKGTALSAKLAATRVREDIELRESSLRLHKAVVQAAGSVRVADELSYRLHVTAPEFPLDEWGDVLPALAEIKTGGSMAADLRAESRPAKRPYLTGTLALKQLSVERAGIPSVTNLSTTAEIEGDAVTIAPADFLLAGSPARLTAKVVSLEKPTVSLTVTSPAVRAAALGLSTVGETDDAEVLREVRVDATIRSTEAGTKVRAKVASAAGRVRGVRYQNLAGDARLEDGRIILNPLSLAAFGGTLRGEGVYDARDPDQPSFNFESRLQSVRVGEIAGALFGAAHLVVDGNLDADLSLAGTGTDWSSISRAVVGGGSLTIREGALKDFNLVDGVLQAIAGVPGLSAMLAPELRQKYPRLLATRDTYFDVLEGRFSIAEGKLATNDLRVKAPYFDVTGKGTIGLDTSVDLTARIDFSPQLSEDLIARVTPVKYLRDSAGRIAIPFTLRGVLPKVQPRPDLDLVAKAIQRAAVESVVGAILPGAGKKPAAGESGTTPEPAAKSAKEPAKASPAQDASGKESATEAPAPKKPAPQERPEEKLLRGLGELLGR